MVKVSVLIPVYNVEKFLPECLNSLIKQTLRDIELICINDGSTDGSLNVLKKYAKKDKRVRIIDKENSGYGDSMNKGMMLAKGEYIGIVESDDFAELDMFEKLYDVARKHNCDVVKSNYYEYYGDRDEDIGESNLFLRTETDRVINPQVNTHIIYQEPCIWAAIYRRKFLEKNKINFLTTPGASYQDTGFNFKVWVSAKSVYFLNNAFLHYRQDNAQSSVKSAGKINYIVKEYEEGEKYLKSRDEWDKFGKIWFMSKIRGYVWNLHRMSFKLAMRFSEVVRSDYLVGRKMGFLSDKNLNQQNRKFLIAAHYPRLYVLMRPLQDLMSSFKRIILIKNNRRMEAKDGN